MFDDFPFSAPTTTTRSKKGEGPYLHYVVILWLPWGSSWADALRHLEKVDGLDDLDVVALNSLMVMLQKGGRKVW